MTDIQIITTKKLIGKHLQEERLNQRLSVYMVAKRAGINKQKVKSVEAGSSRYTLDTYLKIMAALNCSFIIIDERGGNSGLIQVGLDEVLNSL